MLALTAAEVAVVRLPGFFGFRAVDVTSTGLGSVVEPAAAGPVPGGSSAAFVPRECSSEAPWGFDGDEPVDAEDVEDESALDEESDSWVSAHAIPGPLAMAAPSPSATASAPTRPMNLALPAIGRWLDRSSRGIDIEAPLSLMCVNIRVWL